MTVLAIQAITVTKRTGIHVSSLVTCKRRSCFEAINDDKPDISDIKLKYFMGGELIHLYLAELLEEFVFEKEVVWTSPSGIKVQGHIDAFHEPTETVIELKSTESSKVAKEFGIS